MGLGIKLASAGRRLCSFARNFTVAGNYTGRRCRAQPYTLRERGHTWAPAIAPCRWLAEIGEREISARRLALAAGNDVIATSPKIL